MFEIRSKKRLKRRTIFVTKCLEKVCYVAWFPVNSCFIIPVTTEVNESIFRATMLVRVWYSKWISWSISLTLIFRFRSTFAHMYYQYLLMIEELVHYRTLCVVYYTKQVRSGYRLSMMFVLELLWSCSQLIVAKSPFVVIFPQVSLTAFGNSTYFQIFF